MAHRRAKLTILGRQLLVARVVEGGWSVVQAADAAGLSRASAYKWLRRYRNQGEAGLEDATSRPKRCPRSLPRSAVADILRARTRFKLGPHRLATHLGRPRSTIYAVLKRHGCSRLSDLDRPTGVPIRYVRDHPGELLHIDVKKLGRIPQGGGHRIHRGWPAEPRRRSSTVGSGRNRRQEKARGQGYEYVHVAIDDASRVAYAKVLPDERGQTSADFLLAAAAFFAEHGVRIERVLTDNAKAYTDSRAFSDAISSLGARHKLTRPYRPQTNGKAERLIKTMSHEWAYARPYLSNQARTAALYSWLHFYNHHRIHTALGGGTPMARLVNNVFGKHTYRGRSIGLSGSDIERTVPVSTKRAMAALS